MSDPLELVERLRKRAKIRRQISTRKSVQNNELDRLWRVRALAGDRFDEAEIQAAEREDT